MIKIEKNKHNIYPNLFTSVIILTLFLITSGCGGSNNAQPINQDTSEKIIGVEIQLPIDNGKSIIHSEDIEILQEELLSLGANQITIVVEKDEETITLNTPAELCEDEHTGIVKIYAEGDYNTLSEGLSKESSHASILGKMGLEIYISPYYGAKNA